MTNIQLIPRRPRRDAAPALWSRAGFGGLFDDLFRGFAMEPFFFEEEGLPVAREFAPRIDVSENESEIRIAAELPGLEEKDFEIVLEDDVLTLKGEKRVEHEEEAGGWRHVERVGGSFRRQIRIPCEVRADEVKATYKSGVLTVVLPKAAPAIARAIPIETK
jgi:HSP20 family protein